MKRAPALIVAVAFLASILAVSGTAWTAALAASATQPSAKAPAKGARAEPERVVVQHVLIGFKGSVPGKAITRTREEAETLARDILERARKGEDFDALVKQHTNDAAPGIYGMANTGVTKGSAEHSRGGMVKGFGDVSFSLEVGEVGMAAYDPSASPYGWHIVKRLK